MKHCIKDLQDLLDVLDKNNLFNRELEIGKLQTLSNSSEEAARFAHGTQPRTILSIAGR